MTENHKLTSFWSDALFSCATVFSRFIASRWFQHQLPMINNSSTMRFSIRDKRISIKKIILNIYWREFISILFPLPCNWDLMKFDKLLGRTTGMWSTILHIPVIGTSIIPLLVVMSIPVIPLLVVQKITIIMMPIIIAPMSYYHNHDNSFSHLSILLYIIHFREWNIFW